MASSCAYYKSSLNELTPGENAPFATPPPLPSFSLLRFPFSFLPSSLLPGLYASLYTRAYTGTAHKVRLFVFACIRDCNFNGAAQRRWRRGRNMGLSMFKDSPPSGHVLHASKRSFFITTCQESTASAFALPSTTFRLIYLSAVAYPLAASFASLEAALQTENNRVIRRVDRLINKSAYSILKRESETWAMRRIEKSRNQAKKITRGYSSVTRRNGNGCKDTGPEYRIVPKKGKDTILVRNTITESSSSAWANERLRFTRLGKIY